MTCGCNDKCELPKALQINNPGEVTLFHRVEIPASQGDDTTYPPKNGLYRNVLLVYLANNHSYLYNSDGIPTRVDGPQGETGPAGPGVAPGGEAGQVLAKNSDSDYDTTWITQVSANDATLTISRNDTPVGTFTANASVDKTIDIEVPTKTSNLTNDGATGDSTYVEATALSDYYTKSESDSTFQGKLTAGANITIDANNEISATDTTYTAGEGVEINNNTIAAKVRRVYDYYTSRPASANLTATGNGGMFTFQATSSMTTGKPKNDAHILQLEWDNTSGFDSQIALSSWDSAHWMGYRTQSNGTWGDWVYLLNDTAGSVKTTNIDALAVTTAKIADGAITEAKISTTDWAKKVNVASIDITGQTTTLLALTKALGTNNIDYARWECRTDIGSANISDKPTGYNASFVCEAYCNRWTASNDYRYQLIYWAKENNNPFVAYIANHSSSITWERLRPTVNDATLTIQKNGTTVETFTANSSSNKTANITVPTKTSDLTNDGADGTSTYIESDELVPSYITDEGTDITLTNTQGGRFSDVKLKGDTEQTTYSGKNLFNASAIANSNIVVSNNGQTITMPVVSTGNGLVMSKATLAELCPTLAVGDRVYLQMNTTSSVNKYIWLSNSDYLWFPANARTITATDLGSTVGLYGNRIDQGETIQVVISDLRIVRNSTDAFEPYVGGTASPNPDYPQTVQTVTGEQTVAISTKNLITLDAIPDGASSGVSKTFTGSEILLNGTTTGAGGITASTATGVTLPAGTYTFSLTILGGEVTFPSGTTALYIRNGSNGEILAWNLNTRPYVVQTRTLSVATPIRIELYTNAAGQIYNNYRLGLQIESGSTATSYKPYQKQTYTINLGTTELCKIGNYQDYIYKNNGTWYLHKEIRHISLNVSDMNNQENYAGWNNVPELSNLATDLGSGLNTGLDQATAVMTNFITPSLHSLRVNTAAGGKILFLPTYAYPNLTQTQWQAQYPNLVCEIYYGILNQPADTPITGTLLDDLNAFDQATSYQGTTYITVSSVSPDLPATLSVTTEEKIALPTATEANAGVVSVGDGLEITEGGVLSLADNLVYASDPTTPMDNVVDPYTYSTDEQVVGTWIDGKKIYSKTFEFPRITPTANNSVNIGAHGITNFLKALKIEAQYRLSWETSTYFTADRLAAAGMGFHATTTNLYIDCSGSTAWSGQFTITLFYVKTTD